jgi:hypothetical protein
MREGKEYGIRAFVLAWLIGGLLGLIPWDSPGFMGDPNSNNVWVWHMFRANAWWIWALFVTFVAAIVGLIAYYWYD